jgi:hypothetical protein
MRVTHTTQYVPLGLEHLTSYLSKPKARSRVGSYFYLGGRDEPADNPNQTPQSTLRAAS